LGIRAEHNSTNASSDDRLSAVLPHELASLSPCHFNQVLLEQSQRLKIAGRTFPVNDLERESRSFKLSVYSESSLSGQLAKHGPTTGFDDAWRPVGLRFPLLKQFCGELASVFPGTATHESDFSILNWEFDEYRSSFTEFSLEGIMQCKQFKMLSSMHYSSPSAAL
jgi:hypothetical protein